MKLLYSDQTLRIWQIWQVHVKICKLHLCKLNIGPGLTTALTSNFPERCFKSVKPVSTHYGFDCVLKSRGTKNKEVSLQAVSQNLSVFLCQDMICQVQATMTSHSLSAKCGLGGGRVHTRLRWCFCTLCCTNILYFITKTIYSIFNLHFHYTL